MSKMSELHAELEEQASELGYESLGEAEQAGYGVDWDNHKLIPPEEAAHKTWLVEKEEVLRGLKAMFNALNGGSYSVMTPYELTYFLRNNRSVIARAIRFIEKGEY